MGNDNTLLFIVLGTGLAVFAGIVVLTRILSRSSRKALAHGEGAEGVRVTAVRDGHEIVVAVENQKGVSVRDLSVEVSIAGHREDEVFMPLVHPKKSASFRYAAPSTLEGVVSVWVTQTIATNAGDSSFSDHALVTPIPA